MADPKPVTVRVGLAIPMPPNFLRAEDGRVIPIQDLSDKDLRGVAKQWTALLLLKARNRRRKEAQRG